MWTLAKEHDFYTTGDYLEFRYGNFNTGSIKELQTATHGEYMLVLHNGVRLQSSRTYHARLKALTSNPF